MMNLRNFKIFGFRSFGRSWKPKKLHVLSLLLIGVVGTLAMVMLQSGETETVEIAPVNQLGGAATVVKETGEPQEEEDKEFFEYKGECAYKIKQKQDDVNDLTSQAKGYEEEYERLVKGYEQKLQELKEQYQVPQDNAKADSEKARRQLKKVEESLAKIKASCDRAYP